MLTRATRYPGPDGEVGTEDDVHNNQTTPFIDQNQTYTSHPSHQVFLREYELRDHDGDPGTPDVPVDTGRLLDGTLPAGGTGGLATWADVSGRPARCSASGSAHLGENQEPTEATTTSRTSPTCRRSTSTPTATSSPARTVSRCCRWRTAPRSRVTRRDPVTTKGAARTNHAFLDDIAHGATPHHRDLSGYDNVALDEHFVTGDGRGNENIGLTSVHHVFHSEHNRMAQAIEDVLDKPENAQLKLAFHGRGRTPTASCSARQDPGRPRGGRLDLRAAAVPGRALPDRDAVPAPRLRGVRPQDPAGHRRDRAQREQLRRHHQPGDRRRVRPRRLPVRPLDAHRGHRAPATRSPRGRGRQPAGRLPQPADVRQRRNADPRAGGRRGDQRHDQPGRRTDRRARHRHPAQRPARPAARPRDHQHGPRP